jgi:4-amino-4-deoxychorismate lyase
MAQVNGYDDSILLDDSGQVYETGRANLFWVNNGEVYTREHHVLPGVMRDFVLSIDDIATHFESISLNELLSADEVFITNSIRGVVPVTLINDVTFETHEVTHHVQQRLLEFVLQ